MSKQQNLLRTYQITKTREVVYKLKIVPPDITHAIFGKNVGTNHVKVEERL